MDSTVSAAEKRRALRAALATGRLLRFPGAFSPFVALLAERAGFDGVYVSGAGTANDLGLPDLGLTTETEVASRGRAISRVTSLPTLIDIDTGFGEPIHAARAVSDLDDLGLSGCHLEDQVGMKRCGHLDGKLLVDTGTMVRRISAAVRAKRDPNFLVIARTDARATEGVSGALDRARAYVDAGADMIFPEALLDEGEFAQFRRAIDVPLLANMTEFGKTKLLSRESLESLGINLVIYPMTAFRLAMKAVEDGFRRMAEQGTQKDIVPAMLTRKQLYEILGYQAYVDFDQAIFERGSLP